MTTSNSFYTIYGIFIVHVYRQFPITSVFSGYGSSGDARIYNASEFLEMVQDGSIGFPDPQPFPNDTVDMPFFLVGDDAFSLSEHMQKPYGQRALTGEERILNYRLSRARRVSENAFGILANRFQVIIFFLCQTHAVQLRWLKVAGTTLINENSPCN